jgi:hypothetical protein
VRPELPATDVRDVLENHLAELLDFAAAIRATSLG